MIKDFVSRFMASRDVLRDKFAAGEPETYTDIVRATIEVITADEYSSSPAPDPERIHMIDDGSYAGTLVFVIGEKGYQPSIYYFVKVGYGSCSACDTLRRLNQGNDAPTPEQIDGYMQLALNIVQALHKMGDE